MKILATFDRSPFSETIIPELTKMAALPEAEFILLSVAHVPKIRANRRSIQRPIMANDAMGRVLRVMVEPPDPTFPENKGQAIDRRLDEISAYLSGIAHRLPEGTSVRIEAHIGENVADVIIDRAQAEQVDVIVMATHNRSNLSQALFGSVAEDVVRSAVAPVLLVHPDKIKRP